ncbi:MAG: trypsin-like peptidase domain-containing protein [Nitrososphaerales archaeon]|jgi:S1-C subfamily serine protease
MIAEERSHGHRKLLVGLVVAILVLGSAFIYVSSLGQTSANGSTVSSLQSTISSLESTDSSLQSQLSSLSASSSSGNSSVSGINPERIYSTDSRSIVTIQGSALVTTQSVFGSESSVETVLGSGFVVSESGTYYVVTNYHVVNGFTNMTVTFSDGDAYPLKVVGTDPYSDLAVVSVTGAPASEFAPLQVVPSSDVVVGQPVVVIGNPYGLESSMTYGIVSQLGRTIQEATTGNYSISGVIQFSAPINPGNSGGPLLDAAGEVIGITTATVNGSQGVGFAIPSDTIARELQPLISTGTYAAHPYLGIAGADMNYQLAQASGTNVTYGVLLESVVSGGPASKAGLVAGTKTVTVDGTEYLVGGDTIVSIDGVRIVNTDALATYLEEHTSVGQTIQVGLIRSGQLTTVSLTLGARPST